MLVLEVEQPVRKQWLSALMFGVRWIAQICNVLIHPPSYHSRRG